MNSNKKLLIKALLITTLSIANVIAIGQICKDSYNNAIGYFNKGQYEYINTYLDGCIGDINKSRSYYRDNENGISTIFKVYKLLITSYKKLEQENLAVRKMNELVAFFEKKFSREDVESKLNTTFLTPID